LHKYANVSILYAMRLTKTFVLSTGLLLLTAGVLLTAQFSRGAQTAPTGKLAVTATMYPLAEFARQVGGEQVVVTALVGPGVEPHEYEPPPQALARLYASQVFIYNGAGLEPWVEHAQADLSGRGVRIVEASAGLPLRAATANSDSDHRGAPDPHVWLDPVLASRQVEAIARALAASDPAHTALYQRRAVAYQTKLAALDQAYRDGTSNCARRDIITAHQAFGYVAQRYDLQIHPIAGLSPDAEPAPAQIALVADLARAHDIHYIFFETLTSPKLSQAIASEVGAQTLVLNPLEGLTTEQASQGADYLSVQAENIHNLKIALDCK
jgi:zinc transport system substrate-binding protein